MNSDFQTEIVKTKEYSKVFRLFITILFLITTVYLFFIDKENQNIYLKYAAFLIYLIGIFYLFGQSFIKPKTIGVFKISDGIIHIEKDGLKKNVTLNQLEKIYLKYTDYGSWSTHSIFGNKNYIEITETSGEKHNFEILLRNRTSKNDLERILNSGEFQEKFAFRQLKNSRTEFKKT
ncbi:hypothetical protein [Gelidibacter pelagius]|uniref:PH (Pleckstrin Homology) domain-containing protein n=1 Tax=Gelidibacter pelagius TaxID=2819985 RepID=A0ABS3SNV5_9FLAO|nr:hypothetical protein [Gelidibacter pelagius]MBO3097400.1 hypothetical protein [Gelidibacter pelagius]